MLHLISGRRVDLCLSFPTVVHRQKNEYGRILYPDALPFQPIYMYLSGSLAQPLTGAETVTQKQPLRVRKISGIVLCGKLRYTDKTITSQKGYEEMTMRKKNKAKSLAMFLSTCAASLFIPLATTAADGTGVKSTWNIETKGSFTITADECAGGCKGHTIQGSGKETSNTIAVLSGTHEITLWDVNIKVPEDASGRGALSLDSGDMDPDDPTKIEYTDVHLTLKGDNKLVSENYKAGVRVPERARLTIDESTEENSSTGKPWGGSLEARATNTGSGIGGEGFAPDHSAGDITINSGTVKAYGAATGAGIGGNQDGGAGTITINEGATVEAYGGNGDASGLSPGPGIGGGGSNGGTGDVILNGGDVTVKGGTTPNGNSNYCINAGSLSSKEGATIVIEANQLPLETMDTSNFNGMIWSTKIVKDDQGNDVEVHDTCQVYGYATIPPNNFKVNKGEILNIPPGNAVIIPPGTRWGFAGSVTGGGSIINANLLDEMGGSILNINLEVMLEKSDIIPEKGLIYKGKNKVLLNNNLSDPKGFSIRPQRSIGGKNFDVSYAGWTCTITKKNAQPPAATYTDVTDSGTYILTFEQPNGDQYNFVIDDFTIAPRSLKECTINPIPDAIYTGNAISPEPIVQYDNLRLTKGLDYMVNYQNNTNVTEKAEVIVYARPSGNFTDTQSVNFAIKPIPLENATVLLAKPVVPYNGEAQEPEISVFVGAKELEKDKDYTVEASADNYVNAGEITLTIVGMGNYGGSPPTVTYTIEPIIVDVTAASAQDRKFDGTDDVKILSMEYDKSKILPVDNGLVNLKDFNGVTGKISSSHVGTYDHITFENMTLADKDAGANDRGCNYLLKGTGEGGTVPLDPHVTISQADGPELEVAVDYDVSPNFENRFCAVLKPEFIDNAIEVEGFSYQYEYQIDGEETWRPANNPDGTYTLDDIKPGDEYTFAIRTVETDDVKEGQSEPKTVVFEKLERELPKPVISYTQNENGLYTAVITVDPPVANVQYSFTGEEEDFSENNTKADCEPNTPYTGYIRVPADELYKASAIVASDELTTPDSEVAAPEVSPSGDFVGTINVSLSCATDGAEIYYTIDGSEPEISEENLYAEPFEVSTTLTVKAVAVRENMTQSKAVAVLLNKTGDAAVQGQVTFSEGILDSYPGLANTEYNSPESIMAQLTSILSSIPGYSYERMAFYDISVMLSTDGGVTWVPGTLDNFPEEGVTITMPYPAGTSMETQDFAVGHMFAEDSERLHIAAGVTEVGVTTGGLSTLPANTQAMQAIQKTPNGITFTVKSTSPLAIAWKDTSGSGGSNGSGDDNNTGGDNPDDNNRGDGNPSDPDAQDPRNAQANGTPSSVAADAQNSENDANAVKDAVSSLLPKTGDPVSFIPWILIAAACIGIIVYIKKKNKRRR